MIFSAAIVATSCKDDPNNIPVPLHLVSATTLQTIPKATLAQAGATYFGLEAALFKSDVRVVELVYKTEYPAGTPLNVSGIAAVPVDVAPNFPTMIYLHGTIVEGQAPTEVPEGYTDFALLASITQGVFLLPDYIGYGESDDVLHPYCHGPSLAQTSFDMIRAYKEHAPANFNSNIFITGYSEGGYAAVALHKKIQETSASGMKVSKTVAGSGPYDYVAFAEEFLAKDAVLDFEELGSYLWAISMFKIDYGYSRPWSQILSAEDDAKLSAINYDMGYFRPVMASINFNPHDLFQQSWREGAINGTNTEFIGHLKANSVVDFAPSDSLIFVYGDADNWVYPQSTINAYNTMKNKGNPVKAYLQEGGDHATTADLWFSVLFSRLLMEMQ